MKMGAQYKSLYATVQAWLASQGIGVNANYLKTEITSHPDYPSLIAAADFLNAGKMDFEVVQADATYLKEFNYPLMAHINSTGGGANICSWYLT